MAALALFVAAVVFGCSTFGVSLFGLSPLHQLALGLFCFVVAFLLPGVVRRAASLGGPPSPQA